MGVRRGGGNAHPNLANPVGNKVWNLVRVLPGASGNAPFLGVDGTGHLVYIEGLVSFCFVRVRVPPSAPDVSNAGTALDVKVGG